MEHHQSIPAPTGVSVFGSSLLRVVPDVAVLNVAARVTDMQPGEAFAQVRLHAESVRRFLATAGVSEVEVSRVTLKQAFRYVGGSQEFQGYEARLGFQVVLRDLDQIEPTLVGVVSAGANEVASLDLQTTQLSTHRREARKRAIAAAREKAVVYCEAANTTLGKVLHIEDVNPDILTGVREGHVSRQWTPEDGGAIHAFDPGSITIGAAVRVVYAFRDT